MDTTNPKPTGSEPTRAPARQCAAPTRILESEIGRADRLSRRTVAWLVAWVILAAAAFLLAYLQPETAFVAVIYLFSLLQLARANTWRTAFYSGLSVGMLIAVSRLGFFWNIFGTGAVALWLVYSFWVGLFVAVARICLIRLGTPCGWVLVPFIWCGLEYFRSELYYLRFSWLSPGFAFGASPLAVPVRYLGVYGITFLLMAFACVAAGVWTKSKVGTLAILVAGPASLFVWGRLADKDPQTRPLAFVQVAGVQMEFPTETEVIARLNELTRAHPEAELLVLSEYTFMEPAPERVKRWCREHKRYLIVGGKDPVEMDNFYDTGFVISPDGEIVFRQAKSVPIQFFKDGLPAPEQKLWESPWGKIGICICYDLSYSRVTDRLVREDAQALIVPTMDIVDWGRQQHELHALVGPMRASEYRIPVFRVASSGISQLVDSTGHVQAMAPFPGDGAMISGTMQIRGPGKLPVDRWLAPVATVLTGLATVVFVVWRGCPRNEPPDAPGCAPFG